MRASIIIACALACLSAPAAATTQGGEAAQQHLRPSAPAKRLCLCRQHGPRGGCVRWTCRKQYQRKPWPLH
jgi:hypothetical protein